MLAVFLTAGTSLPGLDAVVHHWGSTEMQRSQPHVEPAGGCFNHYGHCTQGRTATGSGAVGTLVGTTRVEAAVQPVSLRAPTSLHISTDPGATAQPRAPPAPLA
jgi:hypothetical protein